jgi:heme/copper-type cytochrome/quinol oxidase subunit 2
MQAQRFKSSPPRGPRPRTALRGEAAEQAEWQRAAWTWFWMMVGGKLVIMIAIAVVGYYRLHPTHRNLSVVVLLNWSWILLMVVLIAGPAAYWWRLRRARRKRAALIRAEWEVD